MYQEMMDVRSVTIEVLTKALQYLIDKGLTIDELHTGPGIALVDERLALTNPREFAEQFVNCELFTPDRVIRTNAVRAAMKKLCQLRMSLDMLPVGPMLEFPDFRTPVSESMIEILANGAEHTI